MSTTTAQISDTPVKLKTGNFVWHELRTTDDKAAEDFYTHVVGWKAKGSGDPGGMPYTLLCVGDRETAGLMEITPSLSAGGMKAEWVGFVGVDDVDAYAHRLEQAGGKLKFPPQDIPAVGRFASVEDPQGAVFFLFKGSLADAPTPPPEGTPGTVGWNELAANDGESAWPFYSGLFGWKEDSIMDMGPMGAYRIFSNGGNSIGGMMTRDHSKSSAPTWLYYINVGDIDAAAARIQEKQGVILMGPHEVPGPVWIILANDPQGVMFAVVGTRKTAAA
ncbi:VOC family protein [Terriglobus saanensis]|uniref:Glyoxalase/bleomycin resistance protein/dioxygenase n=1 Tax=Terriglobus saanensis (strain ATCC BAA-1853 / DSM 23119 / SP1PR4) TaxID=401053 RepID=E8V2Q0_TERSS|nr:VOC family protein [Terriglobus saanensis]ADV83525.1 Glyoxalase/bleomycin resistance protein/dioxygenase [Terriglobus saanensis SP1PR4]